MSKPKRRNDSSTPLESVAGNGLIDRRALLGSGIALAGAVGTGVGASLTSAAAEPLTNGPWSFSRPACLSRPMASHRNSSRRWCGR